MYVAIAVATNPIPQRTARKIPARGSVGAEPGPGAGVRGPQADRGKQAARGQGPGDIRTTIRLSGSIVMAGAVR